ncbi:NLRC3, partial [Symbiodinium pilosum]
ALGQALKDNHSLTEMDLGCNRVGDDEVQVFAMALKTNRKLKQLGLGGNLITNAGVEALAEALQVNRTVTEIDLQYNEISEVGMEALQDALQVHKALKLIASDKNLRYGVTEASLATSAKQEPGSRQFRILPRLE